ncbi:hypothetical protein BBJ29_008656 [Phytophthora kernoviae]|uniref:RxLR effector protein n=1 Tax=Phytophthora kernoviae TaxID=325452 RepID=A0A3F2REW2_9STRA|nr:hypothetical protein BBP00_00009316 [Phytophthora kernoviae]RLN55234.1 hypothetical protein BBJ29_008656 [Phytophthora kernoviae]
MRLANFLLVAAVAHFASCEAVSAVTDSTFLWTTKKEEVDDDDDLDSEDEERVFNALKYKFLAPEKEVVAAALARDNTLSKTDQKIKAAIDRIPGGERKIINWKENELDPSDVKSPLGLTHTRDLQDPDTRLYKLFLAVYLRDRFKVN